MLHIKFACECWFQHLLAGIPYLAVYIEHATNLSQFQFLKSKVANINTSISHVVKKVRNACKWICTIHATINAK